MRQRWQHQEQANPARSDRKEGRYAALHLVARRRRRVGGAGIAGVSEDDAARDDDVCRTYSSQHHVPRLPDVSRGTGEVVPLGQATEIVVFGAGCGGTCDLRSNTLSGGSIILDEIPSGGTCPQVCRPGPLELGRGSMTDVVVGGTGIFEGATGTLTGTVSLEGSNARPAGTSTVKLSGTITYDP
jgi:hypothetical protein